MEQYPVLYVVVPCFNEADVLPVTAKCLQHAVETLVREGGISLDSRIVFVNDGSNDDTWRVISVLHAENAIFSGISLSKNRGHQNALLAGLMTVRPYVDAVISMDADLQDDIHVMAEMVEKYKAGCEIVYGVRRQRDTDSWFKRFTAEGFYVFMRWMGAEIVYNHADYRLLGRKALDGLADFSETNLFLRGMVPMIGYQAGFVYYTRGRRAAGESKYPLKKMAAFAWQGVTSLTVAPIRFITKMGIAVSVVSFLVLLWAWYARFSGNTIDGWASVMMSVWFIGGLVLFAVGVIGEYVGKVYLESKRRPRYIVSEFLHQAVCRKDKVHE